MKGYVHLYTGNGKGKTTAALGLAIRAVGADKRVYIAQFVKGMHYSEIEAVEQYLPTITIVQYGRDCFIEKNPENEDIEMAQRGLNETAEILQSKKYDLVVLDEACIAMHYRLFSVIDLIRVLEKRPPETEIVVTGRYAPPEMIDYADLVTEMKEVRHYYNDGIQARKGIEY